MKEDHIEEVLNDLADKKEIDIRTMDEQEETEKEPEP